MLKRNKVLVAFMVVAVLCMSIGFAAIADNLFVDGTINLDVKENGPLDKEFETNIYFNADGVVAADKGTANTAPTVTSVTATRGQDSESQDNDKITVTIPEGAFTAVGQKITVTATIKNDSTTKANLKYESIANTTMGSYVEITTDWTNSESSVNANGTTTITVTFTLKQVPANTATGTFGFTIVAEPTV